MPAKWYNKRNYILKLCTSDQAEKKAFKRMVKF